MKKRLEQLKREHRTSEIRPVKSIENRKKAGEAELKREIEAEAEEDS